MVTSTPVLPKVALPPVQATIVTPVTPVATVATPVVPAMQPVQGVASQVMTAASPMVSQVTSQVSQVRSEVCPLFGLHLSKLVMLQCIGLSLKIKNQFMWQHDARALAHFIKLCMKHTVSLALRAMHHISLK